MKHSSQSKVSNQCLLLYFTLFLINNFIGAHILKKVSFPKMDHLPKLEHKELWTEEDDKQIKAFVHEYGEYRRKEEEMKLKKNFQ